MEISRPPSPQTADDSFEDVLRFWFGTLDERGRTDELHTSRWWSKDAVVDQEIRDRFGSLYQAVVRGDCGRWLASSRGQLAFIIVLDQLSRNMFRGTAGMYAHDARALEVALNGIERGMPESLRHAERQFFYMPLMHAEDVDVQERGVALFAAWCDELAGDLREDVAAALTSAERHRDIVRRFGRFPHRNALLGRSSTREELDFLQQPGSSF